MAFSEQTKNIVNQLIQAEYLNACEKFGEKYNSLHEGYAVLKEEVEEVETEVLQIDKIMKSFWGVIKLYPNETIEQYEEEIESLEHFVECAIKELAQVGAVLMKIKNTLQLKEETTEKRKVCSKDCKYIDRAYGNYCCNGQKNTPYVNLGDDCYYNDRTEETPF
jgi:hypothetical protein